jgi:hypothetical protein
MVDFRTHVIRRLASHASENNVVKRQHTYVIHRLASHTSAHVTYVGVRNTRWLARLAHITSLRE